MTDSKPKLTNKRPYTKVYLTELQKKQAKDLANQAAVTESELFRRLLMDGTTFQPSQERAQTVRDLLAVAKDIRALNATVARNGNLFKLAITEPNWAETAEDLEKATDLMRNFWSLQSEIKSAVIKLETIIRSL